MYKAWLVTAPTIYLDGCFFLLQLENKFPSFVIFLLIPHWRRKRRKVLRCNPFATHTRKQSLCRLEATTDVLLKQNVLIQFGFARCKASCWVHAPVASQQQNHRRKSIFKLFRSILSTLRVTPSTRDITFNWPQLDISQPHWFIPRSLLALYSRARRGIREEKAPQWNKKKEAKAKRNNFLLIEEWFKTCWRFVYIFSGCWMEWKERGNLEKQIEM